MPEGAVYVGRGSLWGNPYTVALYGRTLALANYRSRVMGMLAVGIKLDSLRGKSLACWCPLDQPCHADVLLELANAVEPKEPRP
jgi:hypothetical protein